MQLNYILYLSKMHSQCTQNKAYYSELVHTLFLKSPGEAISLIYSLILTGALGALGRRFESCRPDSLKPIHTSELPRLAFLFRNLSTTKVE